MYVVSKGEVVVTDGDYLDPVRYQFDCCLAVGGKIVIVGSYSAELPEKAQREASRYIWETVFGDLT